MELDCYLVGRDPAAVREAAVVLEAAGHGCMWSVESFYDPFLPLAVAAGATSTMRLGTNIAVAFARNPMTVAQTAHDLQRMSGGRFVLGLGTQVRAHIERRFSMPWSAPVSRMREFVAALRDIWGAWETGGPLAFRGSMYRHDLMAPNFDAGPTGYGPPPVFLAAVGPAMTALAAEVADGVLCHPLTTPAYLSSVMRPILDGGGPRRGGPDTFPVVVSVLAITGPDRASRAVAAEHVRRKVAFYASTAAYRPILDAHGLGDLQPELNRMARRGEWSEMATRIDDDVLSVFAVVGEPYEIGEQIRERYSGLAQRATVYELDHLGRLLLEDRYLARPGPLKEMVAGFNGTG